MKSFDKYLGFLLLLAAALTTSLWITDYPQIFILSFFSIWSFPLFLLLGLPTIIFLGSYIFSLIWYGDESLYVVVFSSILYNGALLIQIDNLEIIENRFSIYPLIIVFLLFLVAITELIKHNQKNENKRHIN